MNELPAARRQAATEATQACILGLFVVAEAGYSGSRVFGPEVARTSSALATGLGT